MEIPFHHKGRYVITSISGSKFSIQPQTLQTNPSALWTE